MNQVLPNFDDYTKLEIKTLRFLHSQATRRPFLKDLQTYTGPILKATISDVFAFNGYWDVVYNEAECRIFVGAIVNKHGNNIACASHYLAIAEGTYIPKRVLRKYHFDYVSEADPAGRLSHPYFHLQHAGELPPAMAGWGITDDHLKGLLPEISEPRIFFFPISLAIMINIALREFSSEETLKFSQTNEWRGVIKENEEKILGPYYNRCSTLIQDRRTCLFDHVYIS